MENLKNKLKEKREFDIFQREMTPKGDGFGKSFERPAQRMPEKPLPVYKEETGKDGNYKRVSENLPRNYSGNNVVSSKRTGMSDVAWNWVLKIGEFLGDLIKGVVVIGGILAANIADTVMGSIAVSFLVRPEIQQYSNYPWVNPMNFGIILSLGASSIQIYMWSLIQKRNIPFKTLVNPRNWKNIPKEIGWFLGFAGVLWAIDTFLDISPMFVFYTSAVYGSTGLYPYLVTAVTIIVFLLCGFAEILTSNMREMFGLQTK